ncbi:OmpA family protein [Mucilaginibacter daejeonensis]|uniref:OmpA family protein n=1 Tax=Mucilaginibacter daejeonensis TaxID=398049 RepID=UPI001D17AB8A|nr:OmpA family protein [Mucilaginibacter daejeonensis]UEG55057.1 OmpA family protein [Mucilaginibacter daejeonensis]
MLNNGNWIRSGRASVGRGVIAVAAFVLMSGQTAKAQYVQKLANEQYELYNYSKAAELYLQAYKKKPTLITAENLANSYRLMRDYKEAEKWYAIVVAMPESKPQNIFTYAEVLKNNLRYAEAKEQYKKYYTLMPKASLKELNYWTASCDSAMKWMKNPVPVTIDNEQALNTPESDWGAVRYADRVVFTSDRTDKLQKEETKVKRPFIWFDDNSSIDKRIYGWTGNKYLNLYERGTSGGDIKPFTFIAGTDYHIGAASFTADGMDMYFTLTHLLKDKPKKDTAKITTINLGIYHSRFDAVNRQWSKPEPFAYNKESEYSVGDPFITPDGRTLYFVSNMPGGIGGTDIYYCTKETGVWGTPVNVSSVNTASNERTPFIDAKGNLYLSSDGDKGMGGLDIFKAVKKGDAFASKQNLGYPINSAQDDLSYTLTDSLSGYLSSNRTGGKGSDDIYSFAYKAPVLYKLEGFVFDKNTNAVLRNSTVTLNRINGGNAVVKTDARGHFNFTIYNDNRYRLKGEMNGYLAGVVDTFATAGLDPNAPIRKDIYLEKIVLKKAIRLQNIYYDLDDASIRPDAAAELDKLIKIMKENPTLVIQLSSHTDSRADDDYNMSLSRRRANAAMEYIITVGDIDEDRLIARGYGETRLLNKCSNGVNCTEAEHQWNRRTEFAIIKY